MELQEFKRDLLNSIFAANKHSANLSVLFQAFTQVLGELTGIETEFDMNDWSNVNTEFGVAISPVQAAKCTQEQLRSLVFMQGVKAAIEDKLNQGLPEVCILYAGTGPYATLLVPLLAMLPDLPVRATLLDIHKENVSAVHQLIDKLDVAHCVEEVVCTDALKWQPKDADKFDIIISETMTALLKREPQVWIFKHLFPYLQEDGVLIPESIALFATLKRSDAEVQVGEFFNLQRTTVKKLSEGDSSVLTGTLTIPEEYEPGDGFKLNTHITVYKEHMLGEHESSLNVPFTIPCEATNLSVGAEVKYQYCNNSSPEFIFDFPKPPKFIQTQQIAPLDEKSALGLVGLLSMFQHSQLKKHRKSIEMPEAVWVCLQTLCDELNISLQNYLATLYQSASIDTLEAWLVTQDTRLNNADFINDLNAKLLK